jgi:uncharacterized protein (TIGR03067 family)
MRKYVGLALAAALLVAAEQPKKGDAKDGAQSLEGTWEIVSVTDDGKAQEEAKGTKVIFKGKQITVKTGEGDHKGAFRIDPKKKTFDFTPTEGPNKDQLHKGIYELKKGELKICVAKPDKERPKGFTSEEGSGHMLAVMKRAQDD